MAVIITDMDVPANCCECELNNYHFCNVTGDEIENDWQDSTKPDDCPLKSTDEMISEIGSVYIGYRHAYEVAHDYMNIIHKYCDKEQNNE